MDNFQPLDLFNESIVLDNAALSDPDDADTDGQQKETDSVAVAFDEAIPEQASNEDSAMQNAGREATSEEESETHKGEIHEPSGRALGLCVDLKPDIDDLKSMTRKMSAQLEELSQLFNKRILYTEYEEKIVDQMHKDLRKYKEDMYAQLVRPILMDIIDIRDSIMRIAATYMAKPEGEQSIPNKTFSGYSLDLQDILEKNNIEIYRSTKGEVFTPIKHRAVKKTPTLDQSLHGKIAESLSCGYNYKGITISAEKVIVYCYEEPLKQENKEKSEVN